jgi:hypothetical protein
MDAGDILGHEFMGLVEEVVRMSRIVEVSA